MFVHLTFLFYIGSCRNGAVAASELRLNRRRSQPRPMAKKPKVNSPKRSRAALAKNAAKPSAKKCVKVTGRNAMPSRAQPMADRDESPARQKKLSRRDSNDAADRALKGKYSHISAERLDAIVDKNGVSPVEAVREELKAMKTTEQYVKTQFLDRAAAALRLGGCHRVRWSGGARYCPVGQ
jgi:hypothetical protein